MIQISQALLINFAQRGWWQMSLTVIGGMIALPLYLLFLLILMIWRKLKSILSH